MGGGRYDGLVEYLGGASTPGIGFGAGMERLIMILEETGNRPSPTPGMDLFVVAMGDRALRAAREVLWQARALKLRCDRDFTGKSLKKQFQAADKLGARFVLIIGDREIDQKILVVKRLADGSQQEIPWTNDLKELHELVKIT